MLSAVSRGSNAPRVVEMCLRIQNSAFRRLGMRYAVQSKVTGVRSRKSSYLEPHFTATT